MTKFLSVEPPKVSSGCCSAMQLALRSRTGTGNTRCRDMQTRFRNGLRMFRQCCLFASVPQGRPCAVRIHSTQIRIPVQNAQYPENPSMLGGECEAARGCSEDHKHLKTLSSCRSFVYHFLCHPTESWNPSRFPCVKPF